MAIKKYLKIYGALLKYALMVSTAYRVNFIVELIVELGYAMGRFIFIIVLYQVVDNIAGWGLEEMVLFSGLHMATTNTLLGMTIIENLREIPRKIKDGEIDLVLMKPIDSMFMLTLGKPYFTSSISALTGLLIAIYAATQLDTIFNPWHFFLAVLMTILGVVLGYCVLVLFACLSFVFTNAETLIHIPEVIIFYYKGNPHQVYTGVFKYIFWLVLPVVFMASIPAQTYIKGADLWILLVEIVLTGIFVFLTGKVWKYMIRHYSSAGG